MSWRLSIIPILLFVASSLGIQAQTKKMATAEAKSHIGEQATVCGKVTSTRYAEKTKGQPTFLDLDGRYPNQPFTVVIWGDNRQKFGTPETKYRDKNICVTAKISEYKGEPQSVATSPSEIQVQ